MDRSPQKAFIIHRTIKQDLEAEAQGNYSISLPPIFGLHHSHLAMNTNLVAICCPQTSLTTTTCNCHLKTIYLQGCHAITKSGSGRAWEEDYEPSSPLFLESFSLIWPCFRDADSSIIRVFLPLSISFWEACDSLESWILCTSPSYL